MYLFCTLLLCSFDHWVLKNEKKKKVNRLLYQQSPVLEVRITILPNVLLFLCLSGNM